MDPDRTPADDLAVRLSWPATLDGDGPGRSEPVGDDPGGNEPGGDAVAGDDPAPVDSAGDGWAGAGEPGTGPPPGVEAGADRGAARPAADGVPAGDSDPLDGGIGFGLATRAGRGWDGDVDSPGAGGSDAGIDAAALAVRIEALQHATALLRLVLGDRLADYANEVARSQTLAARNLDDFRHEHARSVAVVDAGLTQQAVALSRLEQRLDEELSELGAQVAANLARLADLRQLAGLPDLVTGTVETAVGRAVDIAVGHAVEIAVGHAVETAVGHAVETAVGHAVETAVGRAVETTVSQAVQTAVEAAVGHAVETAVRHAVGDLPAPAPPVVDERSLVEPVIAALQADLARTVGHWRQSDAQSRAEWQRELEDQVHQLRQEMAEDVTRRRQDEDEHRRELDERLERLATAVEALRRRIPLRARPEVVAGGAARPAPPTVDDATAERIAEAVLARLGRSASRPPAPEGGGPGPDDRPATTAIPLPVPSPAHRKRRWGRRA
jgi:hypothetical protein